MKRATLFLIRWYQKTSSISQLSSLFIKGSCRYTPTCSEYAYQAILKYGTIKGLILGFTRLLRCHPFSKSGHDPVK